MSISRLEQIFRTRDYLDNPLPNRPSFHQLLRQEISTEMDIVNEINNSGKPWGLSETQLIYTPGQDEYTINVTNFGKVMYVERLQGDQYIRYLNVPFSDVDDLDYGTVWQNWGNAYGTIPWITETPEKMSFFRTGVLNSEIKVRIQPQPLTSWTYVIHYMPGYIGNTDPLASAIQIPEHAEMARLRNALSLLAITEWSDNAEADDKKRARLKESFIYQLAPKEANYSRYLKSIAIPKPVFIDDWNG